MFGWRRAVVALGLAACGLLLTGCHVEGTVELIGPDRVSFDLITTGEDLYCPPRADRTYLGSEATNGLVGEPVTTASGEAACHVTGRLPLSQLSFVTGATRTDVAEYAVQEFTFEPDHSEWPDGSITLKLPGEVISANQGTVAGNTVRFDSLSGMDNNLKIVMLSRPGPSNAVIWLIAGGVGGLVLAVLIVGLARVLRRPVPRPTETEPGPDADVPAASVPDGPEPGPDEPVEPPAGTTADTPAAPPASEPEPPPPPDHSVWAPPSGPHT